jgi:DNA-binding transcriptional regulator PaaX
MDEEDLVKDRIRSKQKEEEVAKRTKLDDKRITELTRAEKNREWRMKKENEVSETNWRKVEDRVRKELKWLLLGKYISVEMVM